MKRRADIPKSQFRVDKWICGQISKPIAAELILAGHPHVHSTILGTRDPALKLTLAAIDTNTVPVYPWEMLKKCEQIVLRASNERTTMINSVITNLGIQEKRNLKERTESVLEELLTNAIYHAYHSPEGVDKYARNRSAVLKQTEGIRLQYAHGKSGVFLQVTDFGGTLSLDTFGKSLSRCYSKTAPQIQSKLGGAGLCFYLIFEAATHLKVVTQLGVKTTISCWLSNKDNFDSHTFSFNYFLNRGEK